MSKTVIFFTMLSILRTLYFISQSIVLHEMSLSRAQLHVLYVFVVVIEERSTVLALVLFELQMNRLSVAHEMPLGGVRFAALLTELHRPTTDS